ncbi:MULTISPECIES: hypothetical protein [unclassified Microbacterium]|uniref:hypothetical protein n=1 Tax=unclassified Microbacterium TaxID=2609290 RepID=UPI002882E5B8|nr:MULTISPECIES: hypothetical protein [unclassified Microbacterium]
MSAPASVVDEPKTAVRWLTERLVESANARIDRTIERRAQEAIDRLYRMHSGPSGVCQCGSSSFNHPTIDDHAAADIPIDKAWAVETPA